MKYRLSRYEFNGFSIDAYLVKGAFQRHWNQDELTRMLMKARQSYGVYGKRPLTDELDEKSAVYLARASYPPYEEWLSFRFVPFSGQPYGAGELDIFTCRGRSAETVVKEVLFGNSADFGERLSASSRMCGIHPFNSETGESAAALRHRYSALCYAIISRHFYDDYIRHMGIEWISGIILDKFVEGTLTMKVGGKSYATLFTPAWGILGVKPEDIRLSRRIKGDYPYRFPGYWFNAKQLISMIGILLDGGMLTEDCLRHYLGIARPFSEIVSQNLPTMEILGQLHNLGELLSAKGMLKYGRLTGERLRDWVDAQVSDAPELKLTDVRHVQASVLRFLSAMSAKRVL